MKKPLSLLLAAALCLAPTISAFGWGDDGHQTVGKIASLRIKQRTADRISQILKPGETLANIATWADSVKYRIGKPDPDPDTNAFLMDVVHNEKNAEWHYDDLPLNCANYQTCTGFTPDDDVVHMLNIAIRTLQGHPDPNHPLSERNALKLIVHFVGDMHQPLHIGCGFIDAHGPNGAILIVKDPNVIRQKHLSSDRGANQLIVDNDKKNLHSVWDFDLVTALMLTTNLQSSEALGTFLKDSVRPRRGWDARGPIDTWAAQWATDSLLQSRYHTYKGISITRQRTINVTNSKGEPVMKDGKQVTDVVYDITRPANYDAVNRELVRVQLAKAGYRLAKLLDAIYAH